MTYYRTIFLTVLFVFGIVSVSFGAGNYTDGTYEGEYSFVKVKVTVDQGSISDIKILHHGGGGEKYEEMVEPLLDEIINKQSTDVDAVTGATVSSINTINAVQSALEKAQSR
ncbi:MAG: FMN-binding protein [Candidatus Omnitrophica bacterium]|nr:FMN-binding protein [Candidatus Omnitrophota bacterium]